MKACLLLLAMFVMATMSQAQFSIAEMFVAETLTNNAGETMPARVWHRYEKKDLPVPVVVLLHGSGECGQDNAKQLAPFKSLHTTVLIDDELPPAMYLVPQCTQRNPWVRTLAFQADYRLPRYPAPALRTVKEHLDKLIAEGIADPERLYIAGLSLGGFGTWDAIQRWPDTFAAALPICGSGSLEEAAIKNAATTNLWIFHGAADVNVPVDCSRRMVAALSKVDAPPKYTEYAKVGHNIWGKVLGDSATLRWLFRQRKGKKDPGVKRFFDFF